MAASSRASSYHYVVDEPLLNTIDAEIQAAIPGAEVRLNSCGEACGYGSRARGTGRPDSDLDLLVTVPDAWLASHARLEETEEISMPSDRQREASRRLRIAQRDLKAARSMLTHVASQLR